MVDWSPTSLVVRVRIIKKNIKQKASMVASLCGTPEKTGVTTTSITRQPLATGYWSTLDNPRIAKNYCTVTYPCHFSRPLLLISKSVNAWSRPIGAG